MKKNNRRIIKLFESVPKFDTYSQYSISLEKVFHENSFKNLIKNLKDEKKPKIYSYFDLDEQKEEKNKINYFKHIRNIKKDNSKNNLLYDEETNNNNKEIQNNQIETIETSSNINKIIKKNYAPDSDPFRYNPNYNSILKRSPCFKIIKPVNINIKRPNTFLTEIGDMTISNNNNIKNKNILSFDSKNKKNSINNYKISKEIYDVKKRLSLNKEDKNNHSIKFDKYPGRKEIKLDINPNVSYLEPYNYNKIKNNSLDFNKMISREEPKKNNNNKIEGPSVGYYNPNYEYFDDKIRNITLGNEHVDKNNKKFRLKKLWGSYDFRVEYQLIDNSKLNNDILLKEKNLNNNIDSNKAL